jgi:hypothetical protein
MISLKDKIIKLFRIIKPKSAEELQAQEITGKHYPPLLIPFADVPEDIERLSKFINNFNVNMIRTAHGIPQQYISIDKLVRHPEPSLNVEDYHYSNCPMCAGHGTALEKQDMFQCDECRYVYNGYEKAA